MTERIAGRTIVITGASSGIGECAARQFAALGARVCLVARRQEELGRVRDSIAAAGGQCWIYPADLAVEAGVEAFAQALLADHPRVDVLINNAARSIRRPVLQSVDRLHDYQRTMQLNYFAPVQLTLRLLPQWVERGDGHVVNVSSWSTLLPMPRFSAYVGSKCALEGFSRSLLSEVGDKGVKVTVIHYPLVRTPMIEPTAAYKYLPQMDPEDAAGWMVRAVRTRQARVATLTAEAWNLALQAAPDTTIKWTSRLFRAGAKRLKARTEGANGTD